ncbi:STAS domain-containing protein [Dactylosporangium sp. CA-139114]|uniref:STAS domain-containing protein n=1 Tax=Dactylosporangium sp. CA-139114 TaxID=3239931 RepID=UPI003D978143
MELSVRPGTGATVVTAAGDLDIATSAELRRYLHAILDEHEAALCVDVAAVQFIDSSALGVLVSVYQRLAGRGQSLTLVSPHERLLRTFRLTALDQVFTIVAALPAEPAAA